jgi:hypothetical protein
MITVGVGAGSNLQFYNMVIPDLNRPTHEGTRHLWTILSLKEQMESSELARRVACMHRTATKPESNFKIQSLLD